MFGYVKVLVFSHGEHEEESHRCHQFCGRTANLKILGRHNKLTIDDSAIVAATRILAERNGGPLPSPRRLIESDKCLSTDHETKND